jgi:hypothetical protein
MTRRALNSVRGMVPWGTISTMGCTPETRAQPLAHADAQGLEGGRLRQVGGGLRAHEQLVHGLPPRHDHPELAAEAFDGAQGVLDGARIDVLSAHDDHVIEAPVEPVGKAG